MLELLRSRRSVRKYESRKIEPDKMDRLKEALLRSPSSRGINPWEFIVVEDAETIAKLSRAKKHGSAFIEGAPAVFVITADTSKSDVCIEDCSIAGITLHYTAASLGLGSCWVQLRKRERADGTFSENYVRGLLGLPDNFVVVCMVGAGYPAEEKNPHPDSYPDYSKIHTDGF
jgi:nitroreductase